MPGATNKRAARENVCPADIDIHHLETSATSIQLGKKERTFLQAEVRRARACQKEGGSYTAEDWRRIRQTHSDQNSIKPEDRAAARERAESIHASAASNREHQRMQTDKLAEAQRAAARRTAAHPRSAIDPRTGQVYPGVPGGVINPQSGQVHPDVGAGYINPANGQFIPKQ